MDDHAYSDGPHAARTLRPGARRRRWWPVALLTLAQAVGPLACGPNRINHLHSDANEKTARSASDALDKFADDRGGLTPTLLKNLSTQAAHNRGLNDLRASVDETDLATAITDQTWDGMRMNLFSALGVVEHGDPTNPPPFLDWQRRLDVRTAERYRQVQAAGAVLKALASGEEALIFQAKANLDKVVKELDDRQKAAAVPAAVVAPAAGAAAPAPDADKKARDRRDKLVETVFGFRDAVIAAGREAVKTEARRQEGLALQREILAAVEASRDKAAAYALVAVIGTGLSKRSASLLSEFLAQLEGRLDPIVLSQPTDPQSLEAAAAWARFRTEAENARALVHAALLLEDLKAVRLDAARNRAAAAAVAPSWAGLMRLQAKVEKAGFPGSQVTPPGAAGGGGAPRSVAAVDQYLDQVDDAVSRWFAGANAPAELADALPEIGSEISKALDGFREQIDKLPAAVLGKDLADVLKAAQTDPTGAALGYLQKLLSSSPTLLARMKTIGADPAAKAEFDKNLAQLGGVLKNIKAESAEATNRVIEFLRDLYRLQLNLDEENLRHYRSLASVAREELRRWDLLGKLNGRYRYFYPDVRGVLKLEDDFAATNRDLVDLRMAPQTMAEFMAARAAAPPRRLTFHLFADDAAQAASWNAARGGAAALQPPAAHFVAGTGDQVVATIRRLAQTARQWQFGSPVDDANGENTRGSHKRLSDAIELVNGQLLMVSLNERFSLENGLTLRTEIQEHDLHLDAIADRTREAGLRLGLRDLLAYHASGITEADIQATIGLIQQVLLANISGKL